MKEEIVALIASLSSMAPAITALITVFINLRRTKQEMKKIAQTLDQKTEIFREMKLKLDATITEVTELRTLLRRDLQHRTRIRDDEIANH